MIFILIHLDWSPRQARRQYRRRFGIESSYRCTGQVRGWTTSNNPAYRFVLIAVSFFLLNVWVHLRWLFTQVPRRGRRWLDTQRLQLTRLAKFIIRDSRITTAAFMSLWPRRYLDSEKLNLLSLRMRCGAAHPSAVQKRLAA